MNQNPNVISIPDAKRHLETILKLFRAGNPEPMIFGAEGKPEAVVIPYEQFLRLVDYDTRATRDDQEELLRRKQELDANPEAGLDFDEFVDTLSPELRALVRNDDE